MRCFSLRGRMTRGPFWQWVVILLAVTLVLVLVNGAFGRAIAGTWLSPLVGLAGGLTAAAAVCVHAQRLHDFGYAGLWTVFLAVGGILFTLVVGLVPTSEEDNRYGRNIPENSAFLRPPPR